jgi:serine phosphatase RsbU (regulator of sigma subunit)
VISGLIEQVSAASSFSEAAHLLVDWAQELTGCEAVMLRFREEDLPGEGWIPAVAEEGFGSRFVRDEVLIGADECMCGRVCRGCLDRRFPFFTPGGSFSWGRVQSIPTEFPVAELGVIRGRCIMEGFDSVGIYPLKHEGRPLGCLHLADHARHKFDAHLETLETACRECGPLFARYAPSERRSALIKAVEDVLLPPAPPCVAGLEVSLSFASATETAQLGGDFYDVLELEDGSVLLLVGDYSGKGIGAAGMAARARFALAACAENAAGSAKSFDEFLHEAEAVLRETIPQGKFVTVVVSRYSPDGRLKVVSAGHPAPLVVDEAGRAQELPVPYNPPLAAFEGTSYQEGEGTLAEDQTLLLYTDGITESRRDGQFFGLEGVAEFLRKAHGASLDELTTGICRLSAEFHAPDLPGDDRLVLAARPRK